MNALQQAPEDLVGSGDVAGPVAKQLAASVQQAAKAVDDGDASKSGQAIARFAQFLDQQKTPGQVFGLARTVLDYPEKFSGHSGTRKGESTRDCWDDTFPAHQAQ